MELQTFNALPADEAAAAVRVWAAVPWWVDELVAARPFGSVSDLERSAIDLAARWTAADLDAALAHHPRIGQRPTGTGADADASRREQAAMSAATDDVAERMAAANAAYEERFGRVFLIRAAGRSPEEMLAALERRLGADDATEAAEALEQLREIAALRLHQTLTPPEETP
ncbi:MAG: 2-oxo-4-hydroxy-4-carboxy-5-ureidoimidazoline decarboxylase [Microbacterium sp.]